MSNKIAIVLLIVVTISYGRKYCGKTLMSEMFKACVDVNCERESTFQKIPINHFKSSSFYQGISDVCCKRECTPSFMKQFCCL
uniref:Insulin-like domain-containing protein n=1 Tax=Acrobeloides nanus TaxID=290746 RepID=A0A914EB73_9BILA